MVLISRLCLGIPPLLLLLIASIIRLCICTEALLRLPLLCMLRLRWRRRTPLLLLLAFLRRLRRTVCFLLRASWLLLGSGSLSWW